MIAKFMVTMTIKIRQFDISQYLAEKYNAGAKLKETIRAILNVIITNKHYNNL